jgi:hypothetical protein
MSDLPDLDRPLYGVEAIGRAVGLSKSRTYYCLEKGYIPASKIGKLWFTTPRRIRVFLDGDAAPRTA